MSTAWNNRIVGHDVKPASWFLANPANWRIHPRHQQEALIALLDKVGWVQDVIVNLRTSELWPPNDRNVETLVDGHDRVANALSKGEDTPVPLEYVDLTPEEERLVLTLLDPIGSWAVTDNRQLDDLLKALKDEEDARVRAALAIVAEENNLIYGTLPDTGAGAGSDGGAGGDPPKTITCPFCGETFNPETTE